MGRIKFVSLCIQLLRTDGCTMMRTRMKTTKFFSEYAGIYVCACVLLWPSAVSRRLGDLGRDSVDVQDDAQFEVFVKLRDFYALDAIQTQSPALSQDLHGCTHLLMIWTLLHRNVVARPPVPSKVYRYRKRIS